MIRNALLTLAAYLALLCLAPPPASAQSRVQPLPAPHRVWAPLVPMAQLQALAVTLSQHSDTTLVCEGPLTFDTRLKADGITVEAGTEVDGFVERPDDTKPFIDIIYLPSRLCNAMQLVRRDNDDAGTGFMALIHEAIHLQLESDDESTVECTAFENRWQAIAWLHLPVRLDHEVMAEMVGMHESTLPNYRDVC